MYSKIIGVLDSAPNYCPICGYEFNFKDKYNLSDWLVGCSHSCPECNFQFAKAKTDDILEIAEDLKHYYDKI